MKSLLIKEGCCKDKSSLDLVDLMKLGIKEVDCENEVQVALEKIKKFRYEHVFCDTNFLESFKNFGALEVVRGNDGRIIGLLK